MNWLLLEKKKQLTLHYQMFALSTPHVSAVSKPHVCCFVASTSQRRVLYQSRSPIFAEILCVFVWIIVAEVARLPPLWGRLHSW